MRLIEAAGDVTELQLFAGRLSAATGLSTARCCAAPRSRRLSGARTACPAGTGGAVGKAFQQAMQLIAYLRGVVEHPRMAALVLGKDVQQ